jgi:hypothetical protein
VQPDAVEVIVRGDMGLFIRPSVDDILLERWASGDFNKEDGEMARILINALQNLKLLEQFERNTRAVTDRNNLPQLSEINYRRASGLFVMSF